LTPTGITLTNTTSSQVLYSSLKPGTADLNYEDLPAVEGFRVIARDVNDGNYGVYDFEEDAGTSWSVFTPLTGFPYGSLERAIANNAVWDFQVVWRLEDANGDTNRAVNVSTQREVNAPLEFYRLDTGERLWPVITDWFGPDDSWDHGWEAIIVSTVPYADDFFDPVLYPEHDPADPDYWSLWGEDDPLVAHDLVWMWELNQSDPDTWFDGETWTAEVFRPLAVDGTLSFSFDSTAPTIADSLFTMDDIKVVPNPYYIFAEWDRSDITRKIQFTNVPNNSTIDIYTLSGELIAVLEHSEANYNADKIGTVDWNLWTYEFTEAAYGLYIYVVKTDDGRTKVGKFAIIR
jgi:hypothetical protein